VAQTVSADLVRVAAVGTASAVVAAQVVRAVVVAAD
jgi:hypothetical protein